MWILTASLNKQHDTHNPKPVPYTSLHHTAFTKDLHQYCSPISSAFQIITFPVAYQPEFYVRFFSSTGPVCPANKPPNTITRTVLYKYPVTHVTTLSISKIL